MQKREQGKSGGSAGGGATPPAKRGRPFGSGNNSSSAAASAADSAAPSTLLGPSLHVHNSFADQNNKRIVLALQSGLKNELTWALNTLTLLSFKEKDDMRKDATPLAKIPGLLDALLQVIDDWRDIALPKEFAKTTRIRTLGANSVVSGFGSEYQALGSTGTPHRPGVGSGSAGIESTQQNGMAKSRFSELWLDEDSLFNLDDEGRAEKQQCAVAASNIIRNFSFMPDNEVIMAQHRHCLETAFQCIEDHLVEDEELVTNALETIVNLAPLLDLRIFSSSKPSFIKITEKRAVQAIMGMLESAVKAWHCAAAELLGRLIINPDNEPFLLPFFPQVKVYIMHVTLFLNLLHAPRKYNHIPGLLPQIHKRLIDLISMPALDAQAAAIGALYNLAEVNMDCRLKIANERWAIDRLLKVIKMPHPVPEVCRKSAMILESLVSEPQNRSLLLAYENAFAEIVFTDGRYSDTFARILYELTSRPSNKVAAARGIWGM
ncbi:armadillo repeat-containing protein LFR isoform X1 [Glycine max]|uniref:armadillo repeat-containing protein LFR isoform X1 n=1 Tax=Glycine max TaxID=3847 RepID=UPI001B357656|nr:armadillo repeat-containing protein LFR isoform X1 [Glycine max]